MSPIAVEEVVIAPRNSEKLDDWIAVPRSHVVIDIEHSGSGLGHDEPGEEIVHRGITHHERAAMEMDVYRRR